VCVFHRAATNAGGSSCCRTPAVSFSISSSAQRLRRLSSSSQPSFRNDGVGFRLSSSSSSSSLSSTSILGVVWAIKSSSSQKHWYTMNGVSVVGVCIALFVVALLLSPILLLLLLLLLVGWVFVVWQGLLLVVVV